MKNLKCNACGANMIIDPNDKDYAVCEYCGMKTKLSQDVNVNINLDEDLKTNIKENRQVAKIMFIFIGIIFVITAIVMSFIMFKGSGIKKDSKFEISSFNSYYEMYSGTQSKFFLDGVLDNIITNNKTNKNHKITVVYNDVNSIYEDDIVEVKHSLKASGRYEVSLDYDDDGYINKFIIKNLE